MAAPDGLSVLARRKNGSISASLNSAVLEYQHEMTEGPLLASWKFEDGHGEIEYSSLRFWFGSRLMYPVSDYWSGNEVFRGVIWEMELYANGRQYMTSMKDLANVVLCEYQQDDGDGGTEPAYTPWKYSEDSVREYGVFEDTIRSDTLSSEEAEGLAMREVRFRSDPYARIPVFFGDADTRYLTFQAVGAITLANGIVLRSDRLRHHPDHGYATSEEQVTELGTPTTISEEIRRLVQVVDYNSSVYPGKTKRFQPTISAGSSSIRGVLWELDITDTNERETRKGVSSTTRAWDRLRELAKIPDQDGIEYEILVQPDGGLVYRKRRREPAYFSWPAPKGVTLRDNNTVPTWQAKPGIVRIRDEGLYPVRLPNVSGYPRYDVPIQRVVMRDGDEYPGFHGEEPDEAERRATIEANLRWIQQADDRRNEDDG